MLILNVKEKFICVMRVVSWCRSCQTEEASHNCRNIMKVFFTTLWQQQGETENEAAYTQRLYSACGHFSLCPGLCSQAERGQALFPKSGSTPKRGRQTKLFPVSSVPKKVIIVVLFWSSRRTASIPSTSSSLQRISLSPPQCTRLQPGQDGRSLTKTG